MGYTAIASFQYPCMACQEFVRFLTENKLPYCVHDVPYQDTGVLPNREPGFMFFTLFRTLVPLCLRLAS